MVFLAIIGIIFVAIMVRVLAGSADNGRVDQYIQQKGGRLLTSNWAPLGKGWFGEKSDRIYEITYIDTDGNEHAATCKTSMFTGVYFTEDRITRYSSETTHSGNDENRQSRNPQEHRAYISQMEEELRRLRAENEQLKKLNR